EPLVVVGVESEDVLADQFVGGSVAKQYEDRQVGVENLSSGIAAANAVWGVGDQRAEVQLGTAQVFLRGTQGRVEPADQHRQEEEERQAEDGGAQLLRAMVA